MYAAYFMDCRTRETYTSGQISRALSVRFLFFFVIQKPKVDPSSLPAKFS